MTVSDTLDVECCTLSCSATRIWVDSVRVLRRHEDWTHLQLSTLGFSLPDALDCLLVFLRVHRGRECASFPMPRTLVKHMSMPVRPGSKDTCEGHKRTFCATRFLHLTARSSSSSELLGGSRMTASSSLRPAPERECAMSDCLLLRGRRGESCRCMVVSGHCCSASNNIYLALPSILRGSSRVLQRRGCVAAADVGVFCVVPSAPLIL